MKTHKTKLAFLFVMLLLPMVMLQAQTYDELRITVGQLEAKNKKLEEKNQKLDAQLKKCRKSSNGNCDEIQAENNRLNEEVGKLREKLAENLSLNSSGEKTPLDIKDPVFREYLLKYCDMDDDGVFTQWDAEHTYVIDFSREKSLLVKLDNSKEVTNLKGIEHFVNLKRLVCSGNTIPQIDLSSNVNLETLIANGCELKLLDVSQNTNLVRLECNNNLLYTIDLKGNPNLEKLDINKNKVAAIDLSGCTKLKYLACSGNTLTTLDVSNNKTLESIDCSSNKLTELSFVNNVDLVDVVCANNNLTSVDLQNGRDINYLDCTKNKNLAYVILSKGKRTLADKKDNKTQYK